MSDNHAAPADTHGAKSGAMAKVWKITFVAIGVIIGIFVLVNFGGTLLGVTVDSFNSQMSLIMNSFTNLVNNLSKSVPNLISGLSRLINNVSLNVVMALALPVILFIIGRMIYLEIKKG